MKKIFVFFIFFTLMSNPAFEQCNHQINTPCKLKDGEITVYGTQQCDNNNPWVLVLEEDFGKSGYSLNDLFLNWKINYQGVESDFNFNLGKNWYANTGNTPYIPYTHNMEVGNGILKLISRKEVPPIQGTYVTDWSAIPPTSVTESFDYSSAMIQSVIRYKYGKFEIKCKLQAGHGFWPAFWLFGDPVWNEIDVFEFNNYNTTNQLMTVHYDIDGDGQATSGVESCCEINDGPDYSASFHTYTLIWDDYKIEWYVDGLSIGNLKRRVPKYYYTSVTLNQDVPCENLNNGDYYYRKEEANFPNEPMIVIIGAAIQSGNYAPDETTNFPNALEVKYIKIWQHDNGCCIPYKLYENTDNLPANTNVKDFIKAGNDADILNVSGDVTVKTGQNVVFSAANEVALLPGFTVEPGATFTATNIGCNPLNQPEGEDIVVNNFPSSFSPDGNGADDELCVSVNGATSYTIMVTQTGLPYNSLYYKENVQINSDPVCVWDGTCNYTGNCGTYVRCNKDRNVTIDFKNCSKQLSQTKEVHVSCSNQKILPDSLKTDSIAKNILDEQNNFYFRISPNPCKSFIQMDYLTNCSDQITVDFYTITGQKKKELILPCGKNVKIIDISDLIDGVYSYRVSNSTSLFQAGKIVVIR